MAQNKKKTVKAVAAEKANRRLPDPSTVSGESGRTPTLTVAAPQQLLDALDKYATYLTSKRLGQHVGRAQVVRELLTESLASWEEGQKK